MDNSNRPVNRQSDMLGVNRMGKNIKKSPLHQPSFANTAPQQPQPQVYNINKNDFRSIVQQLTGSPLREPPGSRPLNPPRPPSNRLHRIRPPPLTPINRPPIAVHPHQPAQPPIMPSGPYNNNGVRPPPQYGQPQPSPPMFPPTPTDVWANTAESPISAYMRYLQNSIIDSGPRQQSMQSHQQHLNYQHQAPLMPHGPGQNQAQLMPQVQGNNQAQGILRGPGENQTRSQAPGLLPNPSNQALPSPRMHGHPPPLSPRMKGPLPPLPSPRMHGPPPPLPSPGANGPLLPSPSSQFLLPSPTGFMNMLSPQPPYPSLSPGFQHPPPLSPGFSFSPMTQTGILGPGPQPPPSPGYGFPLSPGFFSFPSPRWRDQ
ncbi:hypothetical protein LIER_27485 [Lithospermum erythrorhizon]|uniref:VQ domain-containing protein n=1 Tax=Lithospermum erythrorhizon TaxID=34254 RepID=A0AAV3RDR3_LITER